MSQTGGIIGPSCYLDEDPALKGLFGKLRGTYSNTGLTAAVTNAINYTPPAQTGLYRLTVMYRATASGVSTSVGVTIGFKDSVGAVSLVTWPFMRDNNTALVVPPFLNNTFYHVGVFLFQIDNSATAITVSTTGTFTGTTYNFAAVLEQLA